MAKERIKVAQTSMIEKYDENMNLVEVHKTKVPDYLKDKVHKSQAQIDKEEKEKEK